MAYGYTLTAAGRTLLLQLQAGNSMTISRIAVGDGEVPDGTNPATLTGLVHEVDRSQATCTVPVVEADTLSFEIEYRNKWDAGTFGEDYTDPAGLTEGFWLKEYAVFALDANGNEIMLYYASLGEFPEAVARWNGRNLVSKRYPVSISIVDDDTDVPLGFPARAFITADYLEERLSSAGYGNTLSKIQGAINELKKLYDEISLSGKVHSIDCIITHNLDTYPDTLVIEAEYGYGLGGYGIGPYGGTNGKKLQCSIEYLDRNRIQIAVNHKYNAVEQVQRISDKEYVITFVDSTLSLCVLLIIDENKMSEGTVTVSGVTSFNGRMGDILLDEEDIPETVARKSDVTDSVGGFKDDLMNIPSIDAGEISEEQSEE